jgi:hypothetical protein
MGGRRAIVGLFLLCAPVFSAMIAQAVSATGTTGYKCEKTGAGGGFTDAHCKNRRQRRILARRDPNGRVTDITLLNNLTGAETAPIEISMFFVGVKVVFKATGVSDAAR